MVLRKAKSSSGIRNEPLTQTIKWALVTFSRTAFNGVVVEAARLPTSRKLGDKAPDTVKARSFFEKGQGKEREEGQTYRKRGQCPTEYV